MGRMFEKRKHTMFKRWDRMAKAFTRAGKEIAIAVKGGGSSPDGNPQLRRAIQNARAVNMPKDRIEGAIKRAAGDDAADYNIVNFEGYGPHGVAILCECATDNTTRTVANVRLAFRKGNGTLGNANSVLFMFTRKGVFRLNPEGIDREELELELIDHGLEELDDGTNDDGDAVLVVICDYTDFGTMTNGLDGAGITPLSSGLEYLPNDVTELSEEQSTEVLELIDRLEQDDDVQNIFHTLA